MTRGTAAVSPGSSAAPAVGEGHAAAAAVAVAAAVVSAARPRARAGGVRGPPRGAVPRLVVVARLPRLVPVSRAVAMLLVSSTSTAVLVLVVSVLVAAAAPAVFTGFGTAVAAQTAAVPRPGLVVLGAIALGLPGPAIPVVFVTA